MRRRGLAVAGVLAAVFAVLGVWSALTTADAPSLAQQTREVAQSLRCPTCAGEDVADSAAPLAEAMRLVVAEQLGDGRSPAEVRAWFAERYGDEVLLDPPRRGAGWLLWLAPVILLGVGAVLLVRRWRRWPVALTAGAVVAGLGVALWSLPGEDVGPPVTAAPQEDVTAIPVLQDAVDRAPGDVGLRVVLARHLEQADRVPEAVEHYASATRLRPLDADLRYRYAFALMRSGAEDRAGEVLTETVEVEPEHAPSLLLLGTLHHRADDERGQDLLRRFLDVAPDHPAAAEVRQRLAVAGSPEAAGAAPGGAG